MKRAEFMASLRELVQQAVDLGPSEESQKILDLKAGLDRAYEDASGLGDDQSGNKEAIRQLTAVIMSSVRSAAGTDSRARQELDAEEEARRLHFQLLEYPLVADVLYPESPIGPDELAPTLLSSPRDALAAVLGAILGTVFPYIVRDRFAARRWLFEYAPGGGYRLRGLRTQAWLGWPASIRGSHPSPDQAVQDPSAKPE